MSRHILLFLTVFSLFSLILFATACNDSTEPEQQAEDPPEDPPENENPPNANSFINFQTVIGDPDMETSFLHMDGDAAHGYSFTGFFDHVVEARLLSDSGATQWSEPITYHPRNILSVENERFTGTVVVGAQDADGDDLKYRGGVTLIGPAGTVIDQLFVEDQKFPLWFNSVESVSDSLFLCIGGAKIGETNYPLVCSLFLAEDSTLQVLGYEVIEELPHGWFIDIELRVGLLNMDTGETTVEYFVDGSDMSESASRTRVNSLRSPMHDLASTEVLWTSHVVGYEGLDTHQTTGHSISLGNNGKVYVSGYTDVNKDPGPSGGGYWRAGLVACLSTYGVVEWTQRVVLSGFSEYYFDLCANSDGVYAIGRYSYYTRSDQRFGYGLLTRFDLTTGEVDYHMTMGEKTCRSSLYCLEVDGATATAAGVTHYGEDGSRQGWFVNVDLSSPPEELLKGSLGGGVEGATEDGGGPGRTGGP